MFFRIFCLTFLGMYFLLPGCGQSHSSTETLPITLTSDLGRVRTGASSFSTASADNDEVDSRNRLWMVVFFALTVFTFGQGIIPDWHAEPKKSRTSRNLVTIEQL